MYELDHNQAIQEPKDIEIIQLYILAYTWISFLSFIPVPYQLKIFILFKSQKSITTGKTRNL